MNCQEIKDIILNYEAGKNVPIEKLQSALEHFEECKECQGFRDNMKKTFFPLRTLKKPSVPNHIWDSVRECVAVSNFKFASSDMKPILIFGIIVGAVIMIAGLFLAFSIKKDGVIKQVAQQEDNFPAVYYSTSAAGTNAQGAMPETSTPNR